MSELDLEPIKARLVTFANAEIGSSDERLAMCAFYEHAPADLPALIAEVERLRAEIFRLLDVVSQESP